MHLNEIVPDFTVGAHTDECVCTHRILCPPVRQSLDCDADVGAASEDLVSGVSETADAAWRVCCVRSSALRGTAELLQLERKVRTQLLSRMKKYPMFSLQ